MGGGSDIKIIIKLSDENVSQAFATIDFPSILKEELQLA